MNGSCEHRGSLKNRHATSAVDLAAWRATCLPDVFGYLAQMASVRAARSARRRRPEDRRERHLFASSSKAAATTRATNWSSSRPPSTSPWSVKTSARRSGVSEAKFAHSPRRAKTKCRSLCVEVRRPHRCCSLRAGSTERRRRFAALARAGSTGTSAARSLRSLRAGSTGTSAARFAALRSFAVLREKDWTFRSEVITCFLTTRRSERSEAGRDVPSNPHGSERSEAGGHGGRTLGGTAESDFLSPQWEARATAGERCRGITTGKALSGPVR